MCATNIHARWNAFHATAAPIFLPYDTHFDSQSWWEPQAILRRKLAALARGHVLVYYGFGTHASTNHTPYPRGIDSTKGDLYLDTKSRPCVKSLLAEKKFICDRCPRGTLCDGKPSCGAVPPSLADPPVDYETLITCKP